MWVVRILCAAIRRIAMRTRLAICMTVFALVPLAGAEIVEEETWYNADGKVVKKVQRTMNGADAKSEPDWDPAWVIRERERGRRGAVPYRSIRRFGRDYGRTYGSGYFHPFASRYYHPRSYVRSGFTGFLWAGRGKTRWGVGYRSSGVNILFTR